MFALLPTIIIGISGIIFYLNKAKKYNALSNESIIEEEKKALRKLSKKFLFNVYFIIVTLICLISYILYGVSIKK
jgi:hypothetical protein